MGGASSSEKSPEQHVLDLEMNNKCLAYAKHMVDLDRTLTAWRTQRMEHLEAVQRSSQSMASIQQLGVVDGETANEHLAYQGISQQRRLDMQVEYKALTGQGPPLPPVGRQEPSRGRDPRFPSFLGDVRNDPARDLGVPKHSYPADRAQKLTGEPWNAESQSGRKVGCC
jgi:hypothetical protein